MRTLYLECKMGAAGDMLMAALYDLLDDAQKQVFLTTMNGLFKDVIRVSPQTAMRSGIRGIHMEVTINGEAETAGDECKSSHVTKSESSGYQAQEYAHTSAQAHTHTPEHTHALDHTHTQEHIHAHYSYTSVLAQIDRLRLPDAVKKHALAIYRIIGEAEACVHGTTLEQIHFHEVGSLDALADVVGCALAMELLAPEQILCSPIHVGNGTVRCAHGILPVPAPATAEILRGVPYYTGDIASELCTPTGAALLKHYASRFQAMPVMCTHAIGIGLGKKEFAAANCVRGFLGDTASDGTASLSDQIVDLSCNIDDMTGEELGFAMETLLARGALDVFYTAIQMKKNRPGILLHCFCEPSDKERFLKLIFKYTTTRGIRFQSFGRAKLSAEFAAIDTPYGTVRNKTNRGYEVSRSKLEYEDLAAIARAQNLSLEQVRQILNEEQEP